MDSLFSSFTDSSFIDWKEKLKQDLKGLSFEDLSSLDDNDLRISPFYTQDNQKNITCQAFQNPEWEICTKIIVQDNKAANAEAINALNNGASGLIFEFESEIQNENDLEVLLKEIGLQYIYISFKFQNLSFTDNLIAYLKSQSLTLEELNCHLDYDPIANSLFDENMINEDIYISFFRGSKGIVNITVDTTVFQNAGANSVTQLSYGLSQLNEYFTILSKNGDLENNLKVNFKLSIGTGFFEEISKIRALRILFSNFVYAYGINADLTISAETSGVYHSYLDVENNILRNSIAGMAAVLGGCDNLYIHEYNDQNTRLYPGFSKRLAINQQLVFKEESYLNKVADIAAGSYFLETYTHELAENAWTLFQEMEAEGGFLTLARKGNLQSKLKKQAKDLIEKYQSQKKSLIGVNKYVNEMEKKNVPLVKIKRNTGVEAINLSQEIISL